MSCSNPIAVHRLCIRTPDVGARTASLIVFCEASWLPVAPFVMGDRAYWLDGAVVYPGSAYAGAPPRSDPGFEIAPKQLVAGVTYLAMLPSEGVIETYLQNTLPGDQPVARIELDGILSAVKIDENRLAVLQTRTLRVVSVRGEPIAQLELPAARSYGDDRCFVPKCAVAELRLADFEWLYAIYVRGRDVHALNVKNRPRSGGAAWGDDTGACTDGGNGAREARAGGSPSSAAAQSTRSSGDPDDEAVRRPSCGGLHMTGHLGSFGPRGRKTLLHSRPCAAA